MRQVKIIVERHPDGYGAYQALADVKSAIRFHVATFGDEMLDMEPPVLEA